MSLEVAPNRYHNNAVGQAKTLRFLASVSVLRPLPMKLKVLGRRRPWEGVLQRILVIRMGCTVPYAPLAKVAVIPSASAEPCRGACNSAAKGECMNSPRREGSQVATNMPAKNPPMTMDS